LPFASDESERLDGAALPGVLWNERLRTAIAERGIATHEEALLPKLLDDLRRGTPALVNRHQAGVATPEAASN